MLNVLFRNCFIFNEIKNGLNDLRATLFSAIRRNFFWIRNQAYATHRLITDALCVYVLAGYWSSGLYVDIFMVAPKFVL